MRVPVRIIQTRDRNGLFSRLVRIDTGEEIDNVLLDGNPDWPWPVGHKVDMMLIFPLGFTRLLPIVVVESIETRPERLLPPALSDLALEHVEVGE